MGGTVDVAFSTVDVGINLSDNSKAVAEHSKLTRVLGKNVEDST